MILYSLRLINAYQVYTNTKPYTKNIHIVNVYFPYR